MHSFQRGGPGNRRALAAMDYLLSWKPPTPIRNLEAILEIKKCVFSSVFHVPGLSAEFRRIFQYTGTKVIFKGNNTSKSLLMHLKDKVQ